MRRITTLLLASNVGAKANDYAILAFRILVSAELMSVHGLKKIGIGVEIAEIVPNPLQLPDALNTTAAIFANLVAPIFIVFGFGTRIAAVFVLGVTLTGLFAMHLHDDAMIRDIPFMYSCCFLLLLIAGSGKISIDDLIVKQHPET